MASRVRSSPSSVSRTNFITLNSGLWLTDEIINYVARSIIKPGVPCMHCYSMYFFQLLIGLGAVPTYNYTAVDNCSATIDRASSIFDLHKLYIPINKGGAYWLLLRVQMVEKSIEL